MIFVLILASELRPHFVVAKNHHRIDSHKKWESKCQMKHQMNLTNFTRELEEKITAQLQETVGLCIV